MNLFISTWALLAAGLIFALPMIYLRVKDTTELADETLYVGYAWSMSTILTLDWVSIRIRMDDSGRILAADEVPRRRALIAEK